MASRKNIVMHIKKKKKDNEGKTTRCIRSIYLKWKEIKS